MDFFYCYLYCNQIDTKNEAKKLGVTTYAITKLEEAKWEAVEKSPILLSQYWKKKEFDNAPMII